MNESSFNKDTKQGTQISLSDGGFYEIEYDTTPMKGVGKYVLKSQPIQPESKEDTKKAELRELFHKMRDLTRQYHVGTPNYSRFFDRRVQQDNSVVFYQQALFMKDFEDDYTEEADFSAYFPYYQMMGYEQLRTYFTWRTKVRKGIIEATSLSYAFLYLYELLNLIGVDHPEDGLHRIVVFWSQYRFYDGTLDRYLPRWIADYHLYYDVPNLYEEFCHQNKLKKSYPKILDHAKSLDLYCYISKYKIQKSTFYSDSTKSMIEECFMFLMDRIRVSFEKVGIRLEELIYAPTRKLQDWKPFSGALFFPAYRQSDRRVVLSEESIYLCRNNVWSHSSVIASDVGKQFLAYVFKKMEAELRKLTKFKAKLKADLEILPQELRKQIEKTGVDLEKLIETTVVEFYREATKTVVQVDHQSLHRIRREALMTQEALIVQEETSIPVIPLKKEEIFEEELAPITDEKVPIAAEKSPWIEWKKLLSETEIQAIIHVLQGGRMKTFADTKNIMVEVLVDGMNEKAFDLIGDNIFDEEHEIYEDYIEQIKGMVG